jgi:MscS family membrane protein
MQELLQALSNLMGRPEVVLVFIVVFATLVGNYLARKLLIKLEEQTLRSVNVWDDALVKSARRPLAWLIWVIGFGWAARVLAKDSDSLLEQIIEPGQFVAVVALFAYFLTRFVNEAEHAFIGKGADVTTAHAVGKLLRVSVIITATLSVLQTMGVSVSGVLAFGGIGGIAIGFAAKDLLANFFGGLMIYLDRPFVVGDWIRSPDRDIEGTVELIGWRLTIIRTFDQRPLYVPNSVFATIALENPSRMRNRRIYETIGLRYEDAPKMALIVADVRKMLSEHPDIDSNRTLIVNFNGFADSSLEFFVYTFTKTTAWVEYHGIKERVLLQILDIVEEHGAEFAFPTRTLHVVQPES